VFHHTDSLGVLGKNLVDHCDPSNTEHPSLKIAWKIGCYKNRPPVVGLWFIGDQKMTIINEVAGLGFHMDSSP
jgi:hypothetical protein